MRWFHIAVIAVLAFVTLVLIFQNFAAVTFSFLNLSLTVPLALLIAIIYVMGAATGGSLWGLIRWAAGGSSRPGA